ncbi:MAG: response regulator [Desulfotignum balticum]|jgi:DNA-binding response OmpR family regulator|uniref:Response regulator n=1 Tax=Desulfotignum balticum TaxID=115781 RepID=A0A931CY71_9BACT|nr:response regulator [Desulfotignum balticum]
MGLKILLVDDEQEFVETLSERLQMRDMDSHAVFDGKTALAQVQSHPPQVLIIDLKMPGMDGIQVLQQVKQTHPLIQVIVLTGHGSEQDRKTCMDLGAYAYFQKPVDIDQLNAAIRQSHEKNLTDPRDSMGFDRPVDKGCYQP